MIFNRNKPAENPPANNPEPPAQPTAPPETPPASFVSEDKFNQFQATMFERLDSLTNHFLQQRSTQPSAPAAPSAPVIEDVTDDEYEAAVAGEIADRRKAAAIIRKRSQADIARAQQQVVTQIEQLQTVGMGAISNLTMQTLTALPHYKSYKKEIDAAINQLDPASRVNAQALRGVYDYVVGQHIDEILAAEREATLRQAAPKPDTSTPGGRTGSHASSTPQSTAPAPHEVLDPLALAAIRNKYGTVDIEKFVKSQGYQSWDQYYEKFYKPYEGIAH